MSDLIPERPDRAIARLLAGGLDHPLPVPEAAMTDHVHIRPANDDVEHDTSSTEPDCVCGPRVEPVQREDGSFGWLIVHHSLDGRETTEPRTT